MSSFGEYVGGYLNFSPEDSGSNTPVGMGIGRLLTCAGICCPVIKSKTVNTAYPGGQLEGRQEEQLCKTARGFKLRNEEPVGKADSYLG